jgi:fused signal recognition particle receptor
MPSGVGLELVLVFVLLAMLVAALVVGRRLRERPIPPGPRRPAGLGARLGRLAGRDRLTDEDWRWLEEALVRADAGRRAAGEVVTRVRERYEPGQDPLGLVAEEVEHVFHDDPPLTLPDDLAVVMVVGVNGTGKTTTIGKLAHRLRQQGRAVAVANSDTFRAAAAEQLGEWASRARADLVAQQQRGADPGSVAFDAVQAARARHRDVLIVDTAGRLHSKQPLMDELGKVKRVLEKAAGKPPDEVLLVVDATTGQNGLAQTKAFTEAVGVTGVVLTKLDGTAKGGIVLAVREELGIPVKLVGTGEGLEDLEPFDQKAFAQSLVAP